MKAKTLDWKNFLNIAMAIPIFPAHVLKNVDGATYLRNYNFKFLPSTGPYLVHEEDIQKGKSITLRRRGDYWAERAQAIPDSLILRIKQALYAYAVQDQKPKHLFGIEIDGGINLSDIKLPDLPLISGSGPATEERLELSFRMLAPSGTFSKEEVAALESLVNNGLGLPADEIKKLTVQTSVRLGAETRSLNLPVGVGSGGLTNSGAAAADDTSTNAASQVTVLGTNDVKWLSVQKTFGPVHVERIGLKLEGSTVSGLLDASLGVNALTIGLSGLEVRSPLDHFDPQFSLQGMSIDFSTEGLEIGGSFLRQELEHKIAGTDKTERYVAYGGMAIIRTGKLTLSAIGSYMLVSGHPSLFIYAVLNYPIGGPPFFFVTGLAAGFGFNRRLIMPGIDDVKTFPLVEQVRRGNSPNLASQSDRQNALVKELAAIEGYIPPQVGQYFLAVGIRFTSFKIVDSFALLAVQFGRQVEIDLLGSSVLIAPSGAEANVAPVARAELALKARYVPDEGFLSVIGKLTSDSFILSKDCHLQGGFAFCSWFSNEHAGDFVLTLGGYHPQFHVPAHYPKVPRVGVSWQVSDALTVKGDSYFALTPHAIMAGGNLEAVWHEGAIRAWFKAGVDLLLQWQPYHYDARVYVSIGASYTFESFGNSTISAELGADLHIWGPDFAMTAEVHCYVFSIHVEYIPNPQPPPAVTWDSFQKGFLPPFDQVCEVHPIAGLLHQTGSGNETYGVLDLKAPAFAVNTTIPVSRFQFAPDGNSRHAERNFHADSSGVWFRDKELTQAEPFYLKTVNGQTALTQNTTSYSKTVGLPGVRPMNVLPGVFESLLKVGIQRLDGNNKGDVESEFTITPVLKAAPAALWGQQSSSPSENLNPKTSLTADTLMGFELHSVVVPTPSPSHPIAVENLRYDPTPFNFSIRWENSVITLGADPDDVARAAYDGAGATATYGCRDAVLNAIGITAHRFDFSHKPSSAVIFIPQLEGKNGRH